MDSRRALTRAGLAAGTVAAAMAGLYAWQPIRYDLIPHRPRWPHPWTDPDSSDLFSTGVRVSVVTAHPDDAEFYIGGLLTRLGGSGAILSLIVATDGDKGYYPFQDANRNRRIRREEQRSAAAAWNADEVVFLGYPDGRLPLSFDLQCAIERELIRFSPEYILLFDPFYPPRMSHRDHRRAGSAGQAAAHQVGSCRWILHFSTGAPNFAIDVSDLWESKRRLLRMHESQFHGSRLNMVDGVVAGMAREAGALLNVEYAEGLRCVRLG